MAQLITNNILPNGDCGLLIRFKPSKQCLMAIHALAAELVSEPLYVMPVAKRGNIKSVNVIPGTDSLVLVFAEPIEFSSGLFDAIESRIENLNVNQLSTKSHEIPVCYDPAVASDVMAVCNSLKLSHEQLVALHTGGDYGVDMLGFLPGFAYLSGNKQALNLARKATPNIHVQAGSVAIAGLQTGIYSLSSPGGWHVIGCTPIQLLDWHNPSLPMSLKPLDKVKFKAISLDEFKNITASADDD